VNVEWVISRDGVAGSQQGRDPSVTSTDVTLIRSPSASVSKVARCIDHLDSSAFRN
jgi:hypothetical protein